jgi:hypothetical protein
MVGGASGVGEAAAFPLLADRSGYRSFDALAADTAEKKNPWLFTPISTQNSPNHKSEKKKTKPPTVAGRGHQDRSPPRSALANGTFETSREWYLNQFLSWGRKRRV